MTPSQIWRVTLINLTPGKLTVVAKDGCLENAFPPPQEAGQTFAGGAAGPSPALRDLGLVVRTEGLPPVGLSLIGQIREKRDKYRGAGQALDKRRAGYSFQVCIIG